MLSGVPGSPYPARVHRMVGPSRTPGDHSGRHRPHVGEPAGRGPSWFEVFGVPVFFHVAVVERSLWVQQDAHVVVCMVPPPDAHAGGRVEA